MYYVDDVKKGSLAEKAGLKKSDIITHIDGILVTDGLYYGYLLCREKIELTVQTAADGIKKIKIDNDYEDIGIINNRPLIENPKSCHNKCVFCFIDQLPKGLRKPLYFKDDDARLSFLTGNYVTLTNLSDEEFENIIKMRLSPVNVSVHTTNDELRIKMLNNKNAGGITAKIKRLVDENIMVNAQIVLCKGYNDGAELEKSIRDLYDCGVNSVSVVPVGLTKFREKLPHIEPFSEKDCFNIIKTIENFGKMFYNGKGYRTVYAADEFYVKAKSPIPKYSYYDDFPQIENGVGLLASFIKEFKNSLSRRKAGKSIADKAVITSYAANDTIKMLIDEFNLKFGSDIEVIKIKNNFFGENVTVAGLLTGKDITEQAQTHKKTLIIPKIILRSEGDLTLDDMTINELEKNLDRKITLCEINGKAFVDTLINIV